MGMHNMWMYKNYQNSPDLCGTYVTVCAECCLCGVKYDPYNNYGAVTQEPLNLFYTGTQQCI